MKYFATLLVGLVFTGAVASADPNCISAADMTEIASAFPQFNGLAGKEFCYNGTDDSALLEAIMFMRNTVWDKSMPKSNDELFSGQFAQDWWGYFKGRINEFVVDDNCPKGVAAYVFAFGGNTMYACKMMLQSTFVALDRASIFMHEARHIDGYPHVTCTRGPRAGLQGACDTHISRGGSYAVSVETYAQMAKYGVELHPALRAYSRAASIIYADEAFENPTQIDREDQFLLMTNNKEFYRLNADASKSLEQLGNSPDLGHIIMRGKHMILMPEDRTQPARYVFARNEGESTQQAHDFAIEYNGKSPAERENTVDFFIGAQWGARVFKNHIVFTCDPRAPTEQDLSTNGVTPTALLFPTGYDRGARVVQMITEQGTVMDIGCPAAGGKAFIRASAFTMDRTFKRIYRSGTKVLGLTPDGKLFEINGKTSTPFATDLDGSIFEIVPTQSYGFYGL